MTASWAVPQMVSPARTILTTAARSISVPVACIAKMWDTVLNLLPLTYASNAFTTYARRR
jgi:hypothetical protein